MVYALPVFIALVQPGQATLVARKDTILHAENHGADYDDSGARNDVPVADQSDTFTYTDGPNVTYPVAINSTPMPTMVSVLRTILRVKSSK